MPSTRTTQWNLVRIIFFSALVATIYSVCPDPPTAPEYAAIAPEDVKPSYIAEDTVKYACKAGYESVPNATAIITCQANDTWTTFSVPFCRKLDCGTPNWPENGKVTFLDTVFGSNASYKCKGNYKLVGDVTIECLDDGKWSGSTPVCQRSCRDPIAPKYADIIELPDLQYFPVGIIINFRCHAGYKYDPFVFPNIQCLEGFTWSKTEEFCKKVNCGEPERIINGTVQKTGQDFGSTAFYTCNTGLTISSNAQRKCTEDGVWSGSPPSCQCTSPCF